MTEFDIQDVLIGRFKELNGFSGMDYLQTDGAGNYANVHFPNAPFTEPDDGRWFDLTFLANEPEPAAIMEDAQDSYTGVLYVDIYTPVDAGEDEARAKYEWVARLFERGLDAGGGVDIERCYVSKKGTQRGMYWIQAAIEWYAEIDREEKPNV